MNPDEITNNKNLDELRKDHKEIIALREKKKKEEEEEDKKERLRQKKYIEESERWTRNEVIDMSGLSGVKNDPNFDQESYYANIEQQNKKQ